MSFDNSKNVFMIVAMTTEIHEPAALRLKTLRRTAGLTQADMAERMGFRTPSGYARWENPELAAKDFLPADKIAQLLEILTPRGVSEMAIRQLGYRETGPVKGRPLSEAAADSGDSMTSVDAAGLKQAFEIVADVFDSDPGNQGASLSATELASLAFAVYDEAVNARNQPSNKARDVELRKIAEDVIRIAKMLKA